MTYSGPKATFDIVAQRYDAARPSYPEELFDALLQRAHLPQEGKILEIGCGTGQATRPLAARGYDMLCLEPGRNLAAVAAHHLQPYPRARVQEVTFEDWPPQEEAFDLVLSAQAFHWIPVEIGYPKAAQVLKPTGSLALIWNLSSDPEPGEVLNGEVQQVYSRCVPEVVHARGENPLQVSVRALEDSLRAQSALFQEVVVERFPWTADYSAEQYLNLLDTYSNHQAMLPDRKRCLFDGIAETIHRHGGTLRQRYSAVLLFARRAGWQDRLDCPL